VLGPRNDAVLPRLVVPNAAKRWLTLTNYDLLFYDDRLIAVKGLTLGRGTLRDMWTEEQTRSVAGAGAGESVRERERRRTEDRVASRTPNAGLESGASDDRIVVEFQDLLGAKLTKHAGIVALRLRLRNGTTLSWFWMSNSFACRYAKAAPVLRDVLGSLLRQ
jgi:hypothetical protein